MAVSRIKKLFGEKAIGPDGAMDRQKMRSLAFSDPAARKTLEAILHPMIREESARRIAAAPGPYIVHVVPLLVGSGDHRTRAGRVLGQHSPKAAHVPDVT